MHCHTNYIGSPVGSGDGGGGCPPLPLTYTNDRARCNKHSNIPCSDVCKSSLIEGGMLNGVNYNFRNTEVCMDFDPKLCLKSNNICSVSKVSSVYKQSTPIFGDAAACDPPKQQQQQVPVHMQISDKHITHTYEVVRLWDGQIILMWPFKYCAFWSQLTVAIKGHR